MDFAFKLLDYQYIIICNAFKVYITPSIHTQLNLLITVFDQFIINLKVGLMNNLHLWVYGTYEWYDVDLALAKAFLG